MATSTTTVTPQPSFHGNYEKDEEPTNWLRRYQLSLPPSYSDSDKIERFELQCAAASPAEECNIQNTLASASTRETHSCAKEERGRDWGHVKWAKQVTKMVLGFGDVHCHFLDVVLENTPEVLRDFLADHYNTWAEFESDVAKTSASQLIWAKQRIANERKLREDVDRLQTQSTTGRKQPGPAPQIAQPSFSLPAAYRYGPRYAPNIVNQPQPAVQYHTTAPTSQNLQPTQLPPPMTPTQMPQNPFTLAAPVPRTNLFYRYRGGFPQTPRGRGGSPADHLRTAAQFATLPQHPDSETGRQAYTQQVQEWHSQHGQEATPSTARPYPLKPGTSPLGSRECFNCGVRMPESRSTPVGRTLAGNGVSIGDMFTCTPNTSNPVRYPVHSTQPKPDPPATPTVLSIVLRTRAMADLRPIRHIGKCVRTTTVGDYPVVHTESQEAEVLPEAEEEQMSCKVPMSPNSSDHFSSLPSMVPSSPGFSSLGSSLIITPVASPTTRPTTEHDNLASEDEDFIVPMLDITLDSSTPPLLDSNSVTSPLNISFNTSSDDLFDSISHSDTSTLPFTMLDDTDTGSALDFATDFNNTLSDMSISESINTTDSYLDTFKINVVDLYTISAPKPKDANPTVHNAASTAQPTAHNDTNSSTADSFLIVTIPSDHDPNHNSQESHTRPIAATEQYVFKISPRTPEDQLENHSERLAKAGAHVRQPQEKKKTQAHQYGPSKINPNMSKTPSWERYTSSLTPKTHPTSIQDTSTRLIPHA
ncbi:hypothetical protein DEU56DRAFT_754307 [Suillus clintonianus]|uniref:uncharacterized protein n=1 Tax=Suillus clintonianus TaxID=1904413 RepID=UPI001B8816D8|nr:uncharacterized protein DEU56DRAFT_754307 [Suillus clintonianus]KAG2144245.1 hypothetical protein DEU56DRAFT_754307 [Suillus clintonianus]